MKNGLYKVEFHTQLGSGSGIVFLQDGKLHGGDSSLYYVGDYSLGEDFTAQVETNLHSKMFGMSSVFGIDNAHIKLTGKQKGDTAELTGTAREAPGVSFKALLKKLKD